MNGAASSPIRYMAGLWSHHLPQALLWRTTCTGPRPGIYRAPTWSWASIDGRIEFDLKHWNHAYVCTSTVLSLHVEYVKSPWGQARAGHLCVKGPVCKLNWTQNRFKTPFAWPHWDGKGHGDAEIGACRVEILPDERPDVRTEWWGDILYGLLVLRINDPDVECRCVVVLNAVKGAEGVFRRVGVVKPISGGCVARWFDGMDESMVKIV